MLRHRHSRKSFRNCSKYVYKKTLFNLQLKREKMLILCFQFSLLLLFCKKNCNCFNNFCTIIRAMFMPEEIWTKIIFTFKFFWSKVFLLMSCRSFLRRNHKLNTNHSYLTTILRYPIWPFPIKNVNCKTGKIDFLFKAKCQLSMWIKSNGQLKYLKTRFLMWMQSWFWKG